LTSFLIQNYCSGNISNFFLDLFLKFPVQTFFPLTFPGRADFSFTFPGSDAPSAPHILQPCQLVQRSVHVKKVWIFFSCHTNLKLILQGFIVNLEIINFNKYKISFTDIILICIMKLILNVLIICELSPC
jgi:hypothetical protein